MATEENKGERDRPARARTQPASGQQSGPAEQSGVAEQVRTGHEARVSVPGASNVDARLDNRVGADRPPLEKFPAKPQQVDGPDVAHQVEHTRRVLADRARGEEDDVPRKGMFSPGPHGLSDESLREGETTKEAAKGAPKADG